MGYTGLKMKGDVIDGGSVVDLMAISATFGFNRFSSNQPIPNAAGNGSIFEVDVHGNANPNVTVTGKYRMNTHTNPQGSVTVSHERLGSFCRIGSPSVLFDDAYGTDLFTGAGSLTVIPTSFTEERNITSSETGSQFIQYNLILVQSKDW